MKAEDIGRLWPPKPQSPKAMTFLRRIRVLVVDDEAPICAALCIALQRAGFDPVSALSGEAAMAIIRNETIDIMLVDLRIPDMRGDVIFEAASAEQPHLRNRTIFLTGDISERAYQHIADCGCQFIQKPFDLWQVVDMVHALSPGVKDQAG